MVKRIIAIFTIFVCASVAWGILGSTIFARTYSSDSELEDRVVSIWGAPHNQSPPTASCERLVPKQVETFENGREGGGPGEEQGIIPLPLENSPVNVDLHFQ